MRLARCSLLVLPLLSACGNTTRATAEGPPSLASASSSSAPVASAPSASPTTAAVASAPSAPASVNAGSAGDAGDAGDARPAAAAQIVADNKVAPTEGPELQDRARGLFDAIAKDEPDRAEAFWFPKEPFLPLKDVKDPAKYWTQLHRSYVNDIHALHKKRKSWDGAEFVGFDGWSKSKWVPPGDEANHIGYYRAFRGKLRYKVGGEPGEIEVRTIITWQGRWYVTHLSKVKR